MYKNLAQMFQNICQKYSHLPAFASRDAQKKFQAISYKELWQNAESLSAALVDLGVASRENVGIFADNKVEWIIADMAVVISGAADVPRGTDITDGDINYIISHADIKLLFVENEAVLARVQRNLQNLSGLKTIVLMEKNSKSSGGALNLYDLIEKGKKILQKNPKIVIERIEQIMPSDLFTLIYTSGTTGTPKGVMLTHRNIISQIENVPISIGTDDRVLSILPVWHIFERAFEMISIYGGACTYYTNVRNLKEDLKIVQPTFLASAPRLWESIYQGILVNLEKSSLVKKILFQSAYFFSSEVQSGLRYFQGKSLQLEERNFIEEIILFIKNLLSILIFFLPYKILDGIVLSKIREATGGKLKGSCSGGGALPIHVDEFFNNIGIPVLEGYGMTETSPVISVRTYEQLVIGTVGPIYANTEVRLIDLQTGKQIFPGENGIGKKGEIHIKGPQVMKGYYKNSEATAKVLVDGWLNTGDIGMMTRNNCLKIVGRSKETIVLLGGENVEPVPIENKLLESPYIDQCMLVGQDQKYLSVLIVPSIEKFSSFGNSLLDLKDNIEVKKILQNEIKRLISSENGFKSFEKIVDFVILPKVFEVGDELSAKLSLKRHVIGAKYETLIQKLYS